MGVAISAVAFGTNIPAQATGLSYFGCYCTAMWYELELELEVLHQLRDNIFIVSPLATLAFELCVVGDTGLKTGWVRCRHGAGRGGVRWGRRGGYVLR